MPEMPPERKRMVLAEQMEGVNVAWLKAQQEFPEFFDGVSDEQRDDLRAVFHWAFINGVLFQAKWTLNQQ